MPESWAWRFQNRVLINLSHDEASRWERKKDKTESRFLLNFAFPANDSPPGTAYQLWNMPMEADQFERILDLWAPFLCDEEKPKRCIRSHLLAQAARDPCHGIFRILPHKNPRRCSRCHHGYSTR